MFKRRNFFLIIIILILIGGSLYFNYFKEEDPNYGYVLKVIDGDSLIIKLNDKQVEVRLIGIDAPEYPTAQGQEAYRYVKDLLLYKKVKIEYGESLVDKYGRTLVYLYLDDLFINWYLVSEGYASPLCVQPNCRYEALFEEAYQKALNLEKGLWRE